MYVAIYNSRFHLMWLDHLKLRLRPYGQIHSLLSNYYSACLSLSRERTWSMEVNAVFNLSTGSSSSCSSISEGLGCIIGGGFMPRVLGTPTTTSYITPHPGRCSKLCVCMCERVCRRRYIELYFARRVYNYSFEVHSKYMCMYTLTLALIDLLKALKALVLLYTFIQILFRSSSTTSGGW